MSSLLDIHGRKIEGRASLTRRVGRWLASNWHKWLPIVISIVAIGISFWSAVNVYFARLQAREVAKLDIRPELHLRAELCSSSPSLEIWNTGPIDAKEVRLQLLRHWYVSEAKAIAAVAKGQDVVIPALGPWDQRSIQLNADFIRDAVNIPPPRSNILEIRITFHREQDLKRFDFSAFYFLRTDNRWVTERHLPMDDPFVVELRAALWGKRADVDRFRESVAVGLEDLIYENKNP